VKSIFGDIADGLAEKGYAVVDHFLSQEEVKNILDLTIFQRGLNQFKKAGIGKHQGHQINEGIRGDYIHWIDKNLAAPPLQIYLSRLEQLIKSLNENLFLSLKDYEAHITIYPTGTFYKRHLDQFNRDDHRKISVIFYLNDCWQEAEGGQLRMFFPENAIDFFPIAGRLICFRSDQIEHEVLPATRTRLSITGWILDQHVELRHL
jgi:SM-20-related protein